MDDRETKTFDVIKDFISLSRSILKKHKSVALWDRLIKKGDTVDVQRCIKSFTIFCKRNKEVIQKKSLIFPPETLIKYSTHIFIDINALVEECGNDEEDRDTVNEYLLTLSALLINDEDSLNALQERENENAIVSSSGNSNGFDIGSMDLSALGLDNSSSEGQFINNILGKVSSVMQEGDMQNPQQGIMKLLASGLMNDVTVGAKEKIDSGQLTLGGIFNCMQKVVQNMELAQPKESPSSPTEGPAQIPKENVKVAEEAVADAGPEEPVDDPNGPEEEIEIDV